MSAGTSPSPSSGSNCSQRAAHSSRPNQPKNLDNDLLIALAFERAGNDTLWCHSDLVCNTCDDNSLDCCFPPPQRTNQGSVIIPRCQHCKGRRKACSLAGKGVRRNWFWGSWADGGVGFAWLDLGFDSGRTLDEHLHQRSVRQPRLPAPEQSLNTWRDTLAAKDRAAGRIVTQTHLPRQRQVRESDLTNYRLGGSGFSRIFNMTDAFQDFQNQMEIEAADTASQSSDMEIEGGRFVIPPPDRPSFEQLKDVLEDTGLEHYDGLNQEFVRDPSQSSSSTPPSPSIQGSPTADINSPTDTPSTTNTASTSSISNLSIEDIEFLQNHCKRQMRIYEQWSDGRKTYHNYRAHSQEMRDLYGRLASG